jgi:hypothetical protein
MSARPETTLFELSLRGYADHGSIWNVVLTSCRVELTLALDARDPEAVFDVAVRAAHVARVAHFASIERAAVELEACAAAAHVGGTSEEDDMLAAGMRLLERMLRRALAPPKEAPS